MADIRYIEHLMHNIIKGAHEALNQPERSIQWAVRSHDLHKVQSTVLKTSSRTPCAYSSSRNAKWSEAVCFMNFISFCMKSRPNMIFVYESHTRCRPVQFLCDLIQHGFSLSRSNKSFKYNKKTIIKLMQLQVSLRNEVSGTHCSNNGVIVIFVAIKKC